jgi:LCP family protein required for cell wall assembly
VTDLLENAPTDAPRDRRRRKPRWLVRIVGVVLGLVFLLVALAGGFLLFLNQKVESNIRHEALLPTQSASPGATPGTQPEVLESKGLNVLMIGSDTRPGDVGRSDVMVLAHIPEDRSKVYLVHFPRDLWMSIPGHGEAKLNAAYAYGGAPLLVQTLQDKLRIRIDHVAKTNMEGFAGMVDAVGGIRVYAEEASTGHGNGGPVTINQGWNDLDGEGALSFVRERYELSQGDISRGKRQQAFIKALLMKTISPEVITNPVKIAQFTDAATKNLVVDEGMTVAFMREEALALRNIRSGDVVFITAPFTGYGWSADGQSIDIVDEPGMAALGDAIRQDRLGDYKRVSVIP